MLCLKCLKGNLEITGTEIRCDRCGAVHPSQYVLFGDVGVGDEFLSGNSLFEKADGGDGLQSNALRKNGTGLVGPFPNEVPVIPINAEKYTGRFLRPT